MDYAELNSEQQDIVMHGDGPTLVIAGPGSGKTKTLISRICYLLEKGQKPENILLLTFTNKAAKEMKSRAEKLIGNSAGKITAGTFHHFANLIVRRYAEKVSLKRNFTILDGEDARAVLKQIVLEDHESVNRGVLDDISRAISLSKLKMQSIEEILTSPEFFRMRSQTEEIISISRRYTKLKQKNNVADFDDLLYFAQQILSDVSIRSEYQNHFTNLLVDEFQDTDCIQAAILSLLYKKDNNLMVVGDDSQSIYSFRGAEIKNILGFKEKYDAKIFFLVKNYRSTTDIVSLVNSIMSNSTKRLDKKLLAMHPEATKPILLNPIDRVEEAHILANMIEQELIVGNKIGVLFRAAYMAGELEVDLSRRGIAYDMRGGIKFFEQRHVKDMISLLKVYQNPSDSVSLIRLFTLFPRIGDKSVSKLGAVATTSDVVLSLAKLDKNGPSSSLLSKIYSGGNAASMLNSFYEGFYRNYLEENFDDYEERKPDIEALVGAASKYESVNEFLEAFSLDLDSPTKPNDHSVILSTIHQAKGLEWDSVFIMGLADGMLPHERSFDIEEERRLFYVAASRAKKKLVMTYPSSSGKFYEFNELRPSRFLVELPENSYVRGEQ